MASTLFHGVTASQETGMGLLFLVHHPQVYECIVGVWAPLKRSGFRLVMPMMSHSQTDCQCPDSLRCDTGSRDAIIDLVDKAPELDITFHGTDDAKKVESQFNEKTFQWGLVLNALASIKSTLGLPSLLPGEHVDIEVDIADDGEHTLEFDDVEWDTSWPPNLTSPAF